MGHEAAIAAIRAQGGTDADVEAYLRSVGAVEVPRGPSERERAARARARAATNAEEMRRAKSSFGEEMATAAVSALDAGTFGLAGLATDALSDGSFRQNRAARRAAYEAMPTSDRRLSTVAGALANPVGTLVRPFQGAKLGLLARTGNAAANTGAQAGLTGAVEGLQEMTPAGLLDAGRQGAESAMWGGALGAGGSLLASAGGGIARLRRVSNATPIDEAKFARVDEMRAADDVLYGAVRREAGETGSSLAIRQVLETPGVKPYAAMVRASEKHANANDAEVLIETYKLMGAPQQKAIARMEGSPQHLADVKLAADDIPLAKARMMSAAADGVPSLGIPGALPTFPAAVRTHATAMGELGAFDRTSKIVRKHLAGTPVAENKIGTESIEALRRQITEMTPREAEAALEATLGRAKEQLHLTYSPLGAKAGVISSTIRAIRAPARVDEIVQLLEKKAGKTPRGLFPERAQRKAEGLLGITTGTPY